MHFIHCEEFLKLSREIQYKIISHSELQIEIENSLFDIISQIIEKILILLKTFCFLSRLNLSETKFLEFISVFDFNDMSGQLWQNLCLCFFLHTVKKCQRKSKRNHQKKKRKCNVKSIIVCRNNKYNQLDEKQNNINKGGSEAKILSCEPNYYIQLLLSSDSGESVY